MIRLCFCFTLLVTAEAFLGQIAKIFNHGDGRPRTKRNEDTHIEPIESSGPVGPFSIVYNGSARTSDKDYIETKFGNVTLSNPLHQTLEELYA